MREKPAQPAPRATEGRPRRKTVDSKDVYKAPPNPYLEQEEPEPPPPPVSPTEEWLGDVPIIDCFDEAQSRKKLDGADLIGVSFGDYIVGIQRGYGLENVNSLIPWMSEAKLFEKV